MKQCAEAEPLYVFYCTGKLLTMRKVSVSSIQFAIAYCAAQGVAKGKGRGRGAIEELYLADMAGRQSSA